MTTNTHSSTVARGGARWFIRETMGTMMAGVILFWCAGRWDWFWGWAAVVTIAYYVIGTALVLWPKNPALLAERTGPKKGSKKWDAQIMSVVGAITLTIYITGGLDARHGWTGPIPTWAHILALIVALLGHTLLLWAVASNAYFSLIVRIQKERGHAVATGGPYRFVRHPGYTGTIMTYLGLPLMLGSLWAVALGVVTAFLIILRTALEDKTLLAELDGYQTYAARVRYRLLPGLW